MKLVNLEGGGRLREAGSRFNNEVHHLGIVEHLWERNTTTYKTASGMSSLLY